jgi:ABC-2 type transport system ATP-binding protein
VTEPAVAVRDLVKRYPKQKVNAVDGLSFNVAAGEVFGLLGPNGAGKTTTVGVLTTRVRPASGGARVAGVDVLRDPVPARSRLAVVPQQVNLDRSLTPRQNLVFHAAYHGVPGPVRRKRAGEMLDQFGLADSADMKVDWYSGGMAQRLMIARALMHEPQVLFLDEPTTGLDPQARLFLWGRLREMRAQGVTNGQALNRTAAAIKGVDRVEQVVTRPGATGPEATGPEATGQSRLRLYVSAEPSALLAPVVSALAAAGATVSSVRIGEPTLEDVFINLTGRQLR